MNKYYFRDLPLLIIAITTVMLTLPGCSKDNDAQQNQATDYSKPDNWLRIPATPDKKLDVFYLYPTTYNSETTIYADINDAGMRSGAAMMEQKQASAFATAGNIYIPFYRQVSMVISTLPMEEQNRYFDSIPGRDVLAAFDYYIKHYNSGRPFIIASHSQGSIHAIRSLLAKYMRQHPDVHNRMIAAYTIGYSVTAQDMQDNPHLKFATGADDTGVIISYNTEMPGMTVDSPIVLAGSIAINPINWKRDATPATAAENLPSRLANADGTFTDMPHYADAKVNTTRGVVECASVDPDKHSMPAPFPYGSYHGGDYEFYYYSLRRNAEDRAKVYFGE